MFMNQLEGTIDDEGYQLAYVIPTFPYTASSLRNTNGTAVTGSDYYGAYPFHARACCSC